MKKDRFLRKDNTRIDTADEIASYFATQAVAPAQGMLLSGNIPVIGEARAREHRRGAGTDTAPF